MKNKTYINSILISFRYTLYLRLNTIYTHDIAKVFLRYVDQKCT